MRCDVNASVRPEGQQALGTKTELKNMNTLRGVHRALNYEIRRQIQVLRDGGTMEQETRRWDEEAGVTSGMRSKEYAHDYRYFPEPDLVPVVLSEEQLHTWRSSLPELPEARRTRMSKEFGIPDYDAGVLAADKAVADYYEEAARLAGNGKAVSNWIMTEMLRALSEREWEITRVGLTPAALAELVRLVDAGAINAATAKDLFNELLEQGGDPKKLVEQRGLAQVSDTGALETLVDQVLGEQAKSVEDYRAGKKNAIQFLMGQVMRMSQGKADPKVVVELLRKKLD
jgi:aspartyl-tRNA(Asn)/glutamyl-tRNA(Gln) amidotransferase subunit B